MQLPACQVNRGRNPLWHFVADHDVPRGMLGSLRGQP